jgi:glutathione S-transferase
VVPGEPQPVPPRPPTWGRVIELRDRVAARPRVAAYLASSRRLPFNEAGVFRHYPELDVAPRAGG